MLTFSQKSAKIAEMSDYTLTPESLMSLVNARVRKFIVVQFSRTAKM
jgi:hypothetical protein